MDKQPDMKPSRGQKASRHAGRLRDWLAKRLGLPALLATGPAPIYTTADEDPELIARLEKLDRSIAVDELSFAPDLRYRAASEPFAIRLLREHEGIAPGCPAVLCPEDADAMSRLIDIASNCGLSVAVGQHVSPDEKALPVSFHRMNAVALSDEMPGLVTFGRGASWQDLRDAIIARNENADTPTDCCVPRGIATLYATPAAAADSGAFHARPVRSVAGEPCIYEMILPASGTILLDGIWLFRSVAKAEAALAAVSRKVPPFQARLIAESDLRIGEKAGLWRLPFRFFGDRDYTALRIAYLGDGMTVRAQRFASTWPVEGCGGVFWRNGGLLDDEERIGLLLDNGLTEVTIHDDGKAAERLANALQSSTEAQASPGDGAGTIIPAIISHRAFFEQGRIRREVTAILPRDFNDPLGQWRNLSQAAATMPDQPDESETNTDNEDGMTEADASPKAPETAQSSMPVQPYGSGTPVSESAEWQAIRAALLPQGEAAPPPPDLEDRAPARHG